MDDTGGELGLVRSERVAFFVGDVVAVVVGAAIGEAALDPAA